MIKPLNGFVLVEVLKEEDNFKGQVILPDRHMSTEVGVGKVLVLDEGLPLQENDLVFYDQGLLTKVKRGDDVYNFIKFDDILGYERC